MLLEERKVDVDQIRKGMYVCRLDRDWIETPFALQGFLIETDQQIAYLRGACEHVYIDIEQSIPADDGWSLDSALAGRPGSARNAVGAPGQSGSSVTRVSEELPRAAQALERITARVAEFLDAFRLGGSVEESEIADVVEPVVASLSRNPDAFFWLQALQKRGEYACSHAISCCALAATLGRQLGLPEAELNGLAEGGLLMDIGMTALPLEVTAGRAALSQENRRMMQEHVELGVQMYDKAGLGNPSVLSMIAHHHERHDSSGYRKGHAGDEVALVARIAGIVDSYDAMISDRPHRSAMSRHDALQSIYRQRGGLYQEDLIEQFMQALGVYPVGSLVELSDGAVAIIMALNPARRLRPAIMLLTDTDKKIRTHFEPLDLMIADRAKLPESSLKIVRGLETGAYGLEPTELYL